MVSKLHNYADCPYIDDVATLKADMASVKSDMRDVKNQLGKFIDSVDTKYVRREELADIKKELAWNKNKLFSIAKDVAMVVAIIGLVLKLGGYV